MALIDEVRSRYSTEILVSVSNPQSSSATTEDTTRSGLAVLDVQARFKMQGITYDNTIDTHVAVAVQGVIARLMVMTAQPGAQEEWDEFLESLRTLAETTSRDRIVPSTDSVYEPSTPPLGSLPTFDPKKLDGYPTGDAQAGTPQD